MIIILKKDHDPKQMENLKAWLVSQQLTIHESRGESHTILGLVGDTTAVDIDLLRALDIVEDVKRVQEPYKNANR
ncbi:MAG: 3-deoxy-7-phosphoheptulonate synthase, partial [Eubacteriales bacterium]|nr:3-deoxy-7-phosphoheptulonate synthase [Eubacteriales bacterium]